MEPTSNIYTDRLIQEAADLSDELLAEFQETRETRQTPRLNEKYQQSEYSFEERKSNIATCKMDG
jgi:hypothetical protein